ncbi:hypothetical protein B7P43_G04190 [Cryptotermes secundus]|uniref:Uncharacterized protein n=1 Tax=Cryptotermes secundus TaxID=105785 RepID=A0A2J7PY17_9NEOP|nr:hypothetical protein B7P43_G04190 [Cryptotermes secundus]
MVHNTFVPQLLATGFLLQTRWFMQDAARPHTANVGLNFLYDIFNWRLISDRFLIISNVDQTVMDLRALLIQACSKITEDMCHPVISNITVRVEEVARRNGSRIEHLNHSG